MSISFQLYSSRGVTSQTAFLQTLADLGYSQVEGYGGVYGDPGEFRAAMDAAGLTMPSGHVGLADLEDNFDKTIEAFGTLGTKHIFVPHIAADQRPSDSAGWAGFARRLTEVGKRVTGAGFKFGWHNHDFELVAGADGGIPLDIILTEAPEIEWEGDLAWVARAGADPAEWVARYGDRLTAIHVKDIAPSGEKLDEDGWSDVGVGTLDWTALTAQVRGVSPNALMVMEHDKPSDALRFATTSIQNFKKF